MRGLRRPVLAQPADLCGGLSCALNGQWITLATLRPSWRRFLRRRQRRYLSSRTASEQGVQPLPAGRLSIDDGVTDSALETAYEDTVVASGAVNPNGCRVPITWCACSMHDVVSGAVHTCSYQLA